MEDNYYYDELPPETMAEIIEEPIEPTYYRHYIKVVGDDIVAYFSTGPQPDRDTTGYILLTDMSTSYQFRMFPGGEENPALMDIDGVYLYRYVNGEATIRPGRPWKMNRQGD